MEEYTEWMQERNHPFAIISDVGNETVSNNALPVIKQAKQFGW